MVFSTQPEVQPFLEELLCRVQAVLGEKLAGVYVFGSLVWGDFDPEISDIDLLAVIEAELSDQEFEALDQVQQVLVRAYPQWENRLEIAYISRQGLWEFKSRPATIAITSPGEPFHRKTADEDWLINGYIVQEKGVALYGPEAATLIPAISKSEYLEAVKKQAKAWYTWIEHTRYSRPYQGYAILTMCRVLYTVRRGEQVSKKQAMEWARQAYPRWAGVIETAWQWRKDYRLEGVDPETTYLPTEKVVHEMIAEILAEG